MKENILVRRLDNGLLFLVYIRSEQNTARERNTDVWMAECLLQGAILWEGTIRCRAEVHLESIPVRTSPEEFSFRALDAGVGSWICRLVLHLEPIWL